MSIYICYKALHMITAVPLAMFVFEIPCQCSNLTPLFAVNLNL